MSTQNPTIPTATNLKGIDATIYDIQTSLDLSLSWLTNGMGRAYKLTKVKGKDSTVFLPEVFLAGNHSKYFPATPDNDKKGQSIFVLGNETYLNYRVGRYGQKDYELSIIFSINLKLIDPTLLLTEDFARHQIMEAEEALTRGLLGKAYRLVIDNCVTEFDDVYSGFDVSKEQGASLVPMSYFRFNCTVTLDEDCQGVSLDRCGAILQNLSQSDICSCIIPSLDFSESGEDKDCLSPQQIADITNSMGFCSTRYAGSDGYTDLYDLSVGDKSISAWINIGFLQSQYLCASLRTGSHGLTIFLNSDGTIGIGWTAAANVVRTNIIDALVSNTWVNVISTFKNTTGTIYINGVSKKTGSLGGVEQAALSRLKIGSRWSGTNTGSIQPFVGGVRNFAIFDKELTSAEATAVFDLGLTTEDYSSISNIKNHYILKTLNPIDEEGLNNGVSVNQKVEDILCEL